MFIQMNRELRKNYRDTAQSIKAYIENIRKRYNVEMQYHDNVGIFVNDYRLGPVLLNYYAHNNEFCKCVKDNKTCCNQCYASKGRIAERARRLKQPFYGRCHMGMEEFVFPVMLKNQAIGYFTVGEFYSERDKARAFAKERAEEKKLDTDIIMGKYDATARKIDFDVNELVTDMSVLTYCIASYAAENITIEEEQKQENDTQSRNYVVDTAKEYIFANYNKDVTLDAIARACFCNSSYLSYIFKKKTGMKVSDYINSFRINRAKFYLSISDFTITQISEKVGFNDSGYFSRVFKKNTGMSPDAFRKREKHHVLADGK